MLIKLKDKVLKNKTVQVVARTELWAIKCDACGKVFAPNSDQPFQTPDHVNHDFFRLSGNFDRCATNPHTGKGLGNVFSCYVCSFACAHRIFGENGWKQIEEYDTHSQQGLKLQSAEIRVLTDIVGQKDLEQKWETQEQQ